MTDKSFSRQQATFNCLFRSKKGKQNSTAYRIYS